MSDQALLLVERRKFHKMLLSEIYTINKEGIPSNSDKHNRASVEISLSIHKQLSVETSNNISERLAGQSSGHKFEQMCADYVAATFLNLGHLRPGDWSVRQVTGRSSAAIAQFEQYAHLSDLSEAAARDKVLAASLGNDYSISPDVVIERHSEPDERINTPRARIIDQGIARRAAIRRVFTERPSLHASISCKWTIRSDRVQNARSEALNLIRNRKGRSPHIVCVAGEPTPSRLSALALGTGDIDCVYHIALPELISAVNSIGQSEASDLLSIMIEGKRLKDISDLPLDLAI